MRWTPAGLVCAPRAHPDAARAALAACPFPTTRLHEVPGWPDPPSAFVAGFYRRSRGHAPAPEGMRELVQVGHEGVASGDHPTSHLCLEALARLPAGAALDAGCGSGLLALAWARLGRGLVLACDLDPQAVTQARASAEASGLADQISVRQGPVEGLSRETLTGRVILANIPVRAHAALLARLHSPPPAALLSGLRTGEAAPVVAGYRRLGMRVVGAARQGRWERWALIRA